MVSSRIFVASFYLLTSFPGLLSLVQVSVERDAL